MLRTDAEGRHDVGVVNLIEDYGGHLVALIPCGRQCGGGGLCWLGLGREPSVDLQLQCRYMRASSIRCGYCENLELTHECCSQHLRMGTARIK